MYRSLRTLEVYSGPNDLLTLGQATSLVKEESVLYSLVILQT